MGKKGDYLKYSIEEINKKLEEKGYKWIEGNNTKEQFEEFINMLISNQDS